MKKSVLLLSVIFQLLFGLGVIPVSANALTGVDEKKTYNLNCSGLGKDWDDCYQEADSLCPEGYVVMKRSTGTVSAPVNGRHTLVPGKKLVIECK